MITKTPKSLNHGYSLLEMVIYIAILIVMLVVIFNVIISVVQSHKAVKASRSMEASTIMSLERISREIRQADSVDVASSILGSSPGKLVLSSLVGGAPRTVEFYIATSTIYIKENGVELGPLTQADSRVTGLLFYSYSTSTAGGIRTEISLESGTSTYYKSGSFYTSTTLR